ncbi:MAG: transposase [Pyrinomonadaceae bacterium]
MRNERIRNLKENTSDLPDHIKKVHTTASKEPAEAALDQAEAKCGKQYPIVFRSWRNKWENLTRNFRYPKQIRKVMQITNASKTVDRQFRKLTKTKGAFPIDDLPLKLLYLGIKYEEKNWTIPFQNWKQTVSQLAIIFEERLDDAIGP